MAGSDWDKIQRWAAVVEISRLSKNIESNWAKRSQLGPGSSWARLILTQSQYGSEDMAFVRK